MEVGIRDVQGFPLLAQPAPRRTTPWLVNLHFPATSPHANGTRHLSHWFIGEAAARKCCTKCMEMTQARLIALEPLHCPLTNNACPHSMFLTVLNFIELHLKYTWIPVDRALVVTLWRKRYSQASSWPCSAAMWSAVSPLCTQIHQGVSF